MYFPNYLPLDIKASKTILIYLRIVEVPTLNLSAIIFAVSPLARWYNTIPTSFLISKEAHTK